MPLLLRPISVWRPMQRAQHLVGNGRNDCAEFSVTQSQPKVTHTTATAATIMRNFHDGPKVVQVSCNTHNGNGRNDYAEFSHDGRSHATHYGNGRNDCAEFSHDGPTKTRATHTTATAATIMWNFHTKASQLAQHTTAMAATIMRNFRTVSTQNPSGKNRLKYLVL